MQPWRIFSFSLLLLSVSVSAYFAGKFGYEAWIYASLTGKAPAKALRWEIGEDGSRYFIQTVYEFKCQEKILTSIGRLAGPLFLNEEAAVARMKERSKEALTVYYDPEAPARSALERTFPISFAIRFAISFLVLIYFLIFKKKLKSIFNQ